jgi:hypothetical protein
MFFPTREAEVTKVTKPPALSVGTFPPPESRKAPSTVGGFLAIWRDSGGVKGLFC